MKYISTRGQSEPVDFIGACLAGLAPDGGLYIPESYPAIAPAKPGEPYSQVAARVISAFAGDTLTQEEVLGLCERAYATFAHQSVTPLTQSGPSSWLLELHHGPTLAFKDVAMQLIGQLYDLVLGKTGRRMTIMCATSGDTGGAAAAAFAGAKHADLVILHPFERVSPIQRLFMTTTGADNVLNLALDTDFDECQTIVKSLFADRDFVDRISLSGVNSINWARIAAQMVYYATSQAALAGQQIRFVVPSGNMGDALAGYVAARCGLLPGGLDIVCAVNENDALMRLFNSGVMSNRPTVATPSPAMDISIPSNFERILFELSGRDSDAVRSVYERFKQAGEAELPETATGRLGCSGIRVQSVSNADTIEEMRQFESDTGWLICPHTAVGTRVARLALDSDVATVVLATASPAKFPETVLEATGREARLPDFATGVMSNEEMFERAEPTLGAVRSRVERLAE
ncbi:threonine synthase [Hyphomonas sp. UBA4494]|jgi:threonine synthase|uniref:threonine synthase n=1 Tax=Hyphomonas sp. UBA4494 TaxID=1946631 RepID=UPI0025BED86C|nr:threonine synthase [Hyphomonas sp. UBA4494]